MGGTGEARNFSTVRRAVCRRALGATGLGPGPEGWGPTACTGGLCGLMKTRGLVWRKTATSLGKEGGGKGEETRGRL